MDAKKGKERTYVGRAKRGMVQNGSARLRCNYHNI